jgi:nucleoside phosphorylase
VDKQFSGSPVGGPGSALYTCPTFSECRLAARAVRDAPHWREVRSVARPRAVSGIIREYLPLSAMLYVAGREGRLVWRSVDEFVLLQPPAYHAREWALSPLGRTWLGRVNRQRSLLTFAAIPMLLLLLALPSVFIPHVGILLVVSLGLAAMSSVAVHFIFGLIYQTYCLAIRMGLPLGRPDPAHEDDAKSHHWTATLLHSRDPGHVDALLKEALARAAEISARVFKPDSADGTLVLMSFRRAVTTPDARRAISLSTNAATGPVEDPIYVISEGSHFEPPRPEAKKPIAFMPAFLAVIPIYIVVTARVVADTEQKQCHTTALCAHRPRTWLAAASWLTNYMLWRPTDLTPATFQARTLGDTARLLPPTFACCIVVALTSQLRYQQNRRNLRYSDIKKDIEARMRILILVALEVERDAVINAVSEVNGGAAVKVDAVAGSAVFQLGRVGSADILLAQSEQGTVSPGAMTLTAHALIKELSPDWIFLTGICFGLWSRLQDGGEQEIGDVVVSTHVRTVDHKKVTDDDGGRSRTISRSERVPASVTLLSAARAATYQWTRSRVFFGTVLSSNTLVHDTRLREALRVSDEEASAGEMELAGLYAAAFKSHDEWIMVKGISDWGMGGMTDDARLRAATAAAQFVVRVITAGALPSRTGPRTGSHWGAADQ